MLFDQLSAVSPHAPVVLDPKRASLNYGAMLAHQQRMLAAFNGAGITRNDRVAIVMPNGAEMAVALLSVMAGATAAPLNPNYRASEYSFYLTDLNAKALLIQYDLVSDARAVARQLRIPIIELVPELNAPAGIFSLSLPESHMTPIFAQSQDEALVLHTSGTTGRPKIVPLTQANLLASVDHITATLQLTAADRCLNVMPLFHIHGIVAALLGSVLSGGSIICTAGYHPVDFFKWLTDLRPTWYTAVPTIHQAVLTQLERQPLSPERIALRFARSSSSALPASVMRGLEAALRIPIIEAYGMTEASHQITSNPLPPGKRKMNSVGLAWGVDAAVVTAEGDFCKPGERGEIAIKGDNVIQGYEKNAEANERSFFDGWFRTGDEGYLDEEGYLFITGRLKEMINRGGEKIAPLEVDSVLMAHPAVHQALTFAVPHDLLGEDVGAVIVLHEGITATAAEIREFAAEHLAYYKVPHLIVFRDDIPKGATGKPQRVGLAQMLDLRIDSEVQRTAYIAPRDALEETIAMIWQEVLGCERVGIDERFLDLGGDSLLAMRVVARLRDALKMQLTLVHFFEAPTIADMGAQIRRMQSVPPDKVTKLADLLQDFSDEQLRALLDEDENSE